MIIYNNIEDKPPLTGREINMWDHTGWGDAIYWADYEAGRMHGHLQEKPKKGDVINCKMQSKQIGQFVVIKTKYMPDPPDQFFCTVSWFGYKQ
jgi:hypothetical protein